LEATSAPLSIAAAPNPVGGLNLNLSPKQPGTWGEDDTIVFTPTWNGGLYRVGAGGGKSELLIAPDPAKKEYAYTWPQFLPGGKDLLFASWGTSFNINRLTLTDKTRSIVLPGFWTTPVYSPTGHLIIGRDNGDVQAVPNILHTTAASPV